MKIDLHTHSNLSDGSLSPSELLEAAAARGLGVLALTDHDTTAGLEEASSAAARVGIAFVGGIELSICEDEGRLQCHVLGYGFDAGAAVLVECAAELRAARRERARTISERLHDLGIELPLESIESSSDGTLGRPHIARQLVERGHCRTPQEAFDRYIGRGKPAFVPPAPFTASRAIDVLHAAGGVAVLAHPMRSTGIDRPGGAAAFIARFAAQGLDGLEVQHPSQTPPQRRKLRRLAAQLGLLQTGGSDFHGAAQPEVALGRGRGDIHVDPSAYHELRSAIAKRRALGARTDSAPGSLSPRDPSSGE